MSFLNKHEEPQPEGRRRAVTARRQRDAGGHLPVSFPSVAPEKQDRPYVSEFIRAAQDGAKLNFAPPELKAELEPTGDASTGQE